MFGRNGAVPTARSVKTAARFHAKAGLVVVAALDRQHDAALSM